MTVANAAALRERAFSAASAGDTASADRLFDQAIRAAPKDISILNSAGAYWSKIGDRARAIAAFERAVAADPEAVEPAINLAILLTNSGRSRDALEVLERCATRTATNARYWSVRAGAERACGQKRDSYRDYDRAWRLDRSNPRAAEGRARLALETGLDARQPYRDALSIAPQEPTVMLGLGQALEVFGEVDEARTIAERLVVDVPGWLPALEWLAQLRWSAGQQDEFTDHYEAVAAGSPNAELYRSRCRLLAGVDQFHKAAGVARRASELISDTPEFALLEAVHAGEAGDDGRAEELFASLSIQGSERNVQEARHRLRTGEPERAEALATKAIAEFPDHIAAWALRDIAWRLLGDSRHEWLHGQPGLIRPLELDLDEEQFETVVTLLDRLHDQSSMPVGQSVRGGSQTRGGLFDRHEPEIAALEASFARAIEGYRAALPPKDDTHPLLRHRDRPWRFAGSWSIRAFEGGRHTEHIHPLGILSSAAYFIVPPPQPDDPQAGWLELGRPPPDLRLSLAPLCAIEPIPGRCALFPSTLYHGTRPFAGGKRMTVATDVHLDREWTS